MIELIDVIVQLERANPNARHSDPNALRLWIRGEFSTRDAGSGLTSNFAGQRIALVPTTEMGWTSSVLLATHDLWSLSGSPVTYFADTPLLLTAEAEDSSRKRWGPWLGSQRFPVDMPPEPLPPEFPMGKWLPP